MTLDQLKGLGCLPSNYQTVKHKSAVTLSEFLDAGSGVYAGKKPVVIDGCTWAATADRVPAAKADTVYSGNGTEVGCWKRSECSFYLQKKLDNKLVTIKRFVKEAEMEELRVGDLDNLTNELDNLGLDNDAALEEALGEVLDNDVALDNTDAAGSMSDENDPENLLKELDGAAAGKMDLDAIQKDLEELGKSEGKENAEVQKLNSFGDDSSPNSSSSQKKKELTPEQEKKKQEREAKKKAEDALINDIRRSGVTTLADREKNITMNQKYGRFLGFIVKSDPVVKVSLKKHFLLSPDKKKILTEEGERSADIRNKFNKGESVPSKYYKSQVEFAFTHAKPPKPVGVVVKTPMKYQIDLTDLAKDQVPEGPDTNDFAVQIMGMETAMTYIAGNYGGSIREADDLLGERATVLQFRSIAKVESNNVGETTRLLSGKLEIVKKKNRNYLLTDGNFFPISTFKTASIQDPTEEDKKLINNNFASCVAAYMKKDPKPDLKPGEIGFDGKDGKVSVKENQLGKLDVTSIWVDGSTAVEVSKYDNKEEKLADVRLPLKEVHTTSKGTVSYRFMKNEMESPEGPLNSQKYEKFIELTGYTKDQFAKLVNAIVVKAPSSKSKGNVLTSDDYLRWKMQSGNYADGTTSFADMQRMLEGALL